MRSFTMSVVIATLAVSLGCGKENKEATPTTTAPTPAPTPTAPAVQPSASAAPAKAVQHVELAIESLANTMTFNKTALTVPTGAEVHLVFKNNSNMVTLPHNWVLVKPGTEASVAAGGLKYGEPAGYINMTDKDMIEHTPMAKPGATSEVTFTAPAPGAYPYICTVPGHYMLMKGVLTVTP
jgi:azurin